VPLKYDDFDLQIEPSGEKFRVRLLNAPTGQATAEFELPFTDVELSNFLSRIGQVRRTMRRVDAPELQAAKAFGGKLFNAVFSGEMIAQLRGSMEQASDHERGLRIRLRLTDVPSLADLPWEFLYDATQNHFLTTSSETPVVRFLDLPQRVTPLRVTLPLRVLVMIASPRNLKLLDAEGEWERLKDSLSDLLNAGQIVLERLPLPTLDGLRLRARGLPFHIFHFIGHGGFDDTAQDGVLQFEDENGMSYPVRGELLGMHLHDHRTLRLAVLNACEGARASRQDPFSGVAQSLLQQRVPAVIAMQFEISDGAAKVFASEFYRAVAEGNPVDAAVCESRKALFKEEFGQEWATPVLYMRTQEGQLFELQAAAGAAAAPGSGTVKAEQLLREIEEASQEAAKRAEAERQAAAKEQQERAAKAAAEAAAKAEAERARAEAADKVRLDREKAEAERAAAERAEAERQAALKAAEEQAAREKGEQERAALAIAEAERAAEARAQAELQAAAKEEQASRAKTEAERLALEAIAEAKRAAAAKAEAERIAREKEGSERVQREAAARERFARLQEEAERQSRERVEFEKLRHSGSQASAQSNVESVRDGIYAKGTKTSMLVPLALAAIAVLGGGVWLVHSYEMKKAAIADSQEHFQAGETFRSQKNWDAAAAEYQEALRLQPVLTAAHFGLGEALLEKNDLSAAEKEYRTVLEEDPQFWRARPRLALAFLRDGHYDDAITQYRTILQTNPQNAQAHYDLAVALEKKGNRDAAMPEYIEASKLDSSLRVPDYNSAAADKNYDDPTNSSNAGDGGNLARQQPKPVIKPIRQGGNVQAAKLIKKVAPMYPPLARQAHIAGTVVLHVIVNKEGVVRKVDVLSGHPLLQQSAIDAVRQWRYRTTFLNGQPVDVDTTVDVVFTLTGLPAPGGSDATPTSGSQPSVQAPPPSQQQQSQESVCQFGAVEYSEEANRLVGTVAYTYQGSLPLNEVALRGIPLRKDNSKIPGLTYGQSTLQTASGKASFSIESRPSLNGNQQETSVRLAITIVQKSTNAVVCGKVVPYQRTW
jgi:TonB family protein